MSFVKVVGDEVGVRYYVTISLLAIACLGIERDAHKLWRLGFL